MNTGTYADHRSEETASEPIHLQCIQYAITSTQNIFDENSGEAHNFNLSFPKSDNSLREASAEACEHGVCIKTAPLGTKGLCVYTIQAFKEGDAILMYWGKLMVHDSGSRSMRLYALKFFLGPQKEQLCIDGSFACAASHINHSKEENVDLVEGDFGGERGGTLVTIKAKKDIPRVLVHVSRGGHSYCSNRANM